MTRIIAVNSSDANDCKKWFDTSDQKDTRNGNLPLGLNKKIIGLLKDEAGDSTISEFVGLRAKLYSFVVNNDYEHATKKAKGVKKAVLDKTIKFDDFMDVSESSKPQERSITMFHNKNHEMHTINQTKRALDGDDDKRVRCPDNISTFAIGHYKTITK